jgi:hypothetical protein
VLAIIDIQSQNAVSRKSVQSKLFGERQKQKLLFFASTNLFG